MKKNPIAIIKANTIEYPKGNIYYRPDKLYPEIEELGYEISNEKNEIYAAVRECLHYIGLDNLNYNTEKWNPLGDIIKPGNIVLIKPNLVMHKNGNPMGNTDCMITHPSLVVPIIDYIIKALNGSGKIIIGDAPMQECDFDYIREYGYQEIIDFYSKKNIDIHFVDFRELKSTVKNGVHYTSINPNSSGTIIDLGFDSEFNKIDKKSYDKFRITNYDPRIMPKHHHDNVHEYYISNYVLSADVIINMPKPKCHRKAGVTISLKNIVGVNTRKEFLPHHTMGALNEQGDEYKDKNIIHKCRSKLYDYLNINVSDGKYTKAKLIRMITRCLSLLLKINKDTYSEGSWWGNKTISKTIADLNKIVFYTDSQGQLLNHKNRNMLILADMIISGEKEGPVYPSPKTVGIIACGTNPVCFDEAIATVMGFDIKKIPTINDIRNVEDKFKIVDKEVVPYIVSNCVEYNNKYISQINKKDTLGFTPSSGWINNIEL